MSRVRTVIATEALLIVGLLAMVGGAYLLEEMLGLTAPMRLSAPISLILAAVPAMFWLVYFYLKDRHEPEPKHYVFGVYLLGAFVAFPVASFLTDLLSGGRHAAGFATLSADRLVLTFLIVAICQELTKYLAVRYSIYLSQEFDEHMDGIIYMTACGIGFATAENYRYLQGLDGSVFLATGVANTVVTTLAHACFAGVTGYALGRAKFDNLSARSRNMTLLGGLLGAAALNGVFTLLEGVVKVRGLAIKPWTALGYAAIFATLVFAATSMLMRKHSDASVHRRVGGAA